MAQDPKNKNGGGAAAGPSGKTNPVVNAMAGKRQGRRVSQFGASEIQQLKQVFSWIDKDKNGSVEPEEIAEVLNKFGFKLSKEEIGDIMDDLDKNGDGVMDFEEFATLMDRRISINTYKNEIKETFNLFDQDKDGVISFNDLKKTLSQLGEEVTNQDVKDMIKEFDTTGKGVIGFEDFMAMMSANEGDEIKSGLLGIGSKNKNNNNSNDS